MVVRRAKPGRCVLAGTLGAALLLSACQAAPGVAPRAAKPRLVSTGGEDPMSAALLPPKPSVTRYGAGVPTPVAPPLVSVRVAAGDDATDAQGGTLVHAAMGGVVRSAAGDLTAVIPPGALDRDAVVTLTRLGTADLPQGAGYLPAMRAQLSLGGARVAPGQTIKLTTALDPAMADRVAAEVAPARWDALGLARDAAGQLALTMPVRGPSPVSVDPPAPGEPAARDWTETEFGALAMPAGAGAAAAGGPARRTLMALLPSPLPSIRLTGKPPTTFDEFHDMEVAGIFSCSLAWSMCVFDQLAGKLNYGKEFHPEECGVTFGAPTPAPAIPAPGVGTGGVGAAGTAATPVVLVTGPQRLPAQVSWKSDDPAIDGLPVPGAIVRFRLPVGPDSGPNEIVADAAGFARTFGPAGATVFPQAMTADGTLSGEPVPTVVTPGMAPVKLTLPAMNPAFMLKVTSQAPLPEAIKLVYQLTDASGHAPERRELTLPIATVGQTDALISFSVALPAKAVGTVRFQLTGVTLIDGTAATTFTTEAMPIARNGVCALDADFRPFLAPK